MARLRTLAEDRRVLAAERIRYFFVDTHGIAHASPRPLFGVYAPIFTESGVAWLPALDINLALRLDGLGLAEPLTLLLVATPLGIAFGLVIAFAVGTSARR